MEPVYFGDNLAKNGHNLILNSIKGRYYCTATIT